MFDLLQQDGAVFAPGYVEKADGSLELVEISLIPLENAEKSKKLA